MVTTRLRVIYGDTDQMGVVYYANYLRYFEAGRNEFIRAKGLRYRDFEERFGLRLPVAEAGVSYRQPARYDDLLRVDAAAGLAAEVLLHRPRHPRHPGAARGRPARRPGPLARGGPPRPGGRAGGPPAARASRRS